MAWIPGDQPVATNWDPGDADTSTSDGFLLTEDGCFLLQENYCRIIINSDEDAAWEPGDRADQYSDPISPEGCPVPIDTAGVWIAGD